MLSSTIHYEGNLLRPPPTQKFTAYDVSADDLLTDNLKHSSSPVDTEIHDLLLDCNHDEKAILTRTLTFLKALLSEFGV